MIFHDPATLTILISIFFAVAAASVAFAIVAVASGARQRRTTPVLATGPVVATIRRAVPAPARHAA